MAELAYKLQQVTTQKLITKLTEILLTFAVNLYGIEPLTDIGEVTARILQFNSRDRTLERQLLISLNRYGFYGE